jgi:hypothetical protein
MCRYVEGSFWSNFSQFSRAIVEKCPCTEIVPMAGIPRSVEKKMKNSAITSFHGEQSVHQVRKQVIKWFSWKKMPDIDSNLGT